MKIRGALERLLTGTPDYRLGERFPPPAVPWSEEYKDAHRRFVAEMLDTPRVTARFAAGRRLPKAYGIGLDERVVELPWLLAQPLTGRMLDAGSALNHAHVLDHLLPRIESLHIVTLVPEEVAYPERGVSYLFADLRELPIRDDYYDCVASVSTLEHIGLDTGRFGAETTPAADPRGELRAVVDELRRVLKPGGTLYATVPYGRREEHGWFRQFDRADVDELVERLAPRDLVVAVYMYAASGWQLSSLEEAAEARYHEHLADPRPVPDLAAGARAVVCLRAVV